MCRCADTLLLAALKRHAARTDSPHAADLFVIPTPVYQSFFAATTKGVEAALASSQQHGHVQGGGGGGGAQQQQQQQQQQQHGGGMGSGVGGVTGHMARVTAAMEALTSSKWFRRRGGRDHLLPAHAWQVEYPQEIPADPPKIPAQPAPSGHPRALTMR